MIPSVGPLLVPGRSKRAEDVLGQLRQGPPERAELGQHGRDVVADRLDRRRHELPTRGAVGLSVGADHPLVDAPGCLDVLTPGPGRSGVEDDFAGTPADTGRPVSKDGSARWVSGPAPARAAPRQPARGDRARRGIRLRGVVGLAASAPLLWRLHRRFGTWWVPASKLLAFAAIFAVSMLVIGPQISGRADAPETPVEQHDAHTEPHSAHT